MPYTTVTLATLRSRLRERVETVPFWGEAEATAALNESLRIWNLLTGTWKTRGIYLTTPNDPWVPLTQTITYALRVEFNQRPLEKASIPELNALRPSWRTETTTSGGDVPSRVTCWAPAGLMLVAIWPTDADGLNSLTFDGLTLTPQLLADGDFVDVGEEILSVLLGYALHVLAFKEGGQRFRGTLPYYRTFLKVAAEENALLRQSAWYRRVMGLDRLRDYSRIQPAPAPSPRSSGRPSPREPLMRQDEAGG